MIRKCRLFTLALIACICVGGCSLVPARIKTPAATVTAVADAGKPATLDTKDAAEVLPLPAGSTITVTEFASVPAIAGVNAFLPARKVTVVNVPAATEWRKTEATVKADTGTVDQSVALKKVDAAESRVLLYAALACLAVSGVFIYLHYPTPAMMSAAAAVVLFLAWKVAGMPDWIWVVGALAVGGAGFLYLGHERGEKAAKST